LIFLNSPHKLAQTPKNQPFVLISVYC